LLATLVSTPNRQLSPSPLNADAAILGYPTVVDCNTDEEARVAAAAHIGNHASIEIWQLQRFVEWSMSNFDSFKCFPLHTQYTGSPADSRAFARSRGSAVS
jgi:hypothetical protein